jgi:hypothetical protein
VASPVAADHLPVDEARPDLEVVHGLHDQREARRPVIAAPSQQPDAHGITSGHHPVAVVLDSWTQFGPEGGLPAGDGRHGSMKRSTGIGPAI